MALPGCSIFIGIDETTAYVRLTGRAAAESAPSFEKALLQLQNEGVRQIVLELSTILLMDSAFSGTIAHLIQHSELCFVLHQAPSRILDTFADHGLLDLVDRLEADGQYSPPQTSEPCILGAGTRKEILRCALDAHRTLIALKPENMAKFQAVEHYLAQAQAAGT
ncbi:MAG: hypothetical protein EXS25_09280 [Pedosphaera sp.]|nr:hypothetical protein [Pedosphaera sp.]